MPKLRNSTRVLGAFPDGKTDLMLSAAHLRHIAGTKWGTKKYLNMKLLELMDMENKLTA